MKTLFISAFLAAGSIATAQAGTCNLAQVDTGFDAPAMYMSGFKTSYELATVEDCTNKAKETLGTVFRCRKHNSGKSSRKPRYRDCHTDAVRFKFTDSGFTVKGTIKKTK